MKHLLLFLHLLLLPLAAFAQRALGPVTVTTINGHAVFDGAFSSLNGKPTTLSGYGITDAQPLDGDLTSIAALTTTSYGRGVLTLTDAAAARTLFGVSTFDGAFSSLTGKPTTLAGYGITDAQPLDSDLTSWALLTRASGFDTFATTPSSANLAALVTDETGTGALVLATSPTLITPALGTPSAVVLTNASGTAASLTAGHVTTNANLTGDVTSVGNATSIAAGSVTNSDLAAPINAAHGGLGFDVSGSSGVPLFAAGLPTFTGTSGTGNFARITSPAFTTPDLGTPSAAVLTNASGTAASLTAGHVTTNANLTGDVTSSGNATTLANIPALSGANLTTLNASNISSGTLGDGRNTVSNSTTTTLSALATIGGLTTVTGTGAMSFTGGAGNATFTAGTGNSRTLIFRTTTSGGTATTALTLNADQSAGFASYITINQSGGEMVIDPSNGTYNDITSGTANFGGWKSLRVRATSIRLANSSDLTGLTVFSSSGVSVGTAGDPGSGNFAVSGTSVFTGAVTLSSTAKLASFTVSTLPSAATAGAGALAFVTDATAFTAHAAPTGGGSVKTPVYSDGTSWLMH